MSFINPRLCATFALVTLISACSLMPSKDKDKDEFAMPDSVAEDLGGAPKADEVATGGTATPEAAAKADADSAAVMERLKTVPTTPAVIARDPEHEKQAQKARPEFDRALLEMKKGNLDGALSQFKQLAATYPLLAGPIVNQAIILRKKGQLEASNKLLQDALLTHGKNAYLLNELGVTSRELGQFKKAQASYESAIRVDPQYAKAHYNLAVLADLYLHDPALALQEFNQYQSLIPEPDKKVEGWIKELERRIAKSK